jgi:hypothetical protein
VKSTASSQAKAQRAFEELERAAVNVEVHFGINVAHQLREPLRARHLIVVAIACRMSSVGLPTEAKVDHALIRRWESVAHAGTAAPDDVDQVSMDMADAKRAVESALRPFVEAPTFGQFLLVHDLWSAIRRAWRLARPGYGKIAIYAAVKLAEPTTDDAYLCPRSRCMTSRAVLALV